MGKWVIVCAIVFVLIAGAVVLFNRKVADKTRIKNISSPRGLIKGNMKITSSAFQNNSSIPSKYTCDGEGVNPPLEFSEVPKGAESLALIMEDPDVPKNLKPDGMFDHWVVFNIPPDTTSIPENSTPPGTMGKSSSGSNVYVGACPPDREHRYFFKLYALDTNLNLDSNSTKPDLEKAMQGHILGSAELIGRYNRK